MEQFNEPHEFSSCDRILMPTYDAIAGRSGRQRSLCHRRIVSEPNPSSREQSLRHPHSFNPYMTPAYEAVMQPLVETQDYSPPNPPVNEKDFLYSLIRLSLPIPLDTIVKSWAGEKWELVIDQLLQLLDHDVQTITQIGAGSWVPILSALSGPQGKLCRVVRGGSYKGIRSITCNLCMKTFEQNPSERFAHHFITGHFEIHPFKCRHCNALFTRLHSCTRHEKTKHVTSSNAQPRALIPVSSPFTQYTASP